MKRKNTRTARTESWLANAWQAQSLLLAYPDEEYEQHLTLAARVAATLPDPVARPLLGFVAHAGQTAAEDLATTYVATFDHRKRCCLYLTYYAHGDTRKRGIGLLRLKQTYAAAGWRLGDDELPDHLAVVLEFAATDPAAGTRLLTGHRAGLELLRLALNDDGSPWAQVLDSVSATLPALAGNDREAVMRLAAQGPPEEQVGLDPYASTVFLPDPVVGGPR
ncbi:nitrate reductase molybdenum cofactor assembly chaperone [Streptomyces finlayi]|uniref:Nitrate reductase molybdenum cofactor assembly chaperone n=1 Tax=Streptomyces finlayi TaxID=67296 RepID=A0A7G7BG48_9ACTN|nr:nitrate reductase molybdenum cofactor assembly chaperone [Streptomyces finlayi]QNE74313.1 nitrate reductase molybdenum cofactor assembly chaperone [Streptomyces finlayi]